MRQTACLAVLALLSVGWSSRQVQPGSATSLVLPEPTVVVVDTGPNATALFPRDSCSWLRNGSPSLRLVPAEAKKRYFQPHCLCIAGQEGVPPCTPTAQSEVPAAASAPATPPPNNRECRTAAESRDTRTGANFDAVSGNDAPRDTMLEECAVGPLLLLAALTH